MGGWVKPGGLPVLPPGESRAPGLAGMGGFRSVLVWTPGCQAIVRQAVDASNVGPAPRGRHEHDVDKQITRRKHNNN